MFCAYFPPQYSGAAKQAVALSHCLERLGHHIEFVTIKDPDVEYQKTHEGFRVHRIDVGNRRNQEWPLWPKLLRFALENKGRFDIFHSHGAHYLNSIVGPIAKLAGWKCLVKATMHNGDLNGLMKSKTGVFHYAWLRLVDAYIGISNDLVGEFSKHRFNKGRIHHIPNGVDTNRFKPVSHDEKIELRKRLDLPVHKHIALSVGVYDKRKNIGWLVKEWVKANGFANNGYLTAIGPQSREDLNGGFLKSIQSIASHRGDVLKVLGHIENIVDYYKAADFFILPSLNEGLPNVILEALASGLPCIAARSSGSVDLLKEGFNGYLYKKNNSLELSEKILKILGQTNGELNVNARTTAENNYSIEKIATQYSDLYETLMKH